MNNVQESQYPAIANLLTTCFIDDQLILRQTKGIEKYEEFLKQLFLSQITVLARTCELHTIDDGFQSVLIGYEKRKYYAILGIVLSLLCQKKLLNSVNRNDINTFAQNTREVSRLVDLKWHKKYLSGNYYYIKAIAIAKECRETGIFRKLIMPIIQRCNEKQIPIILETNTADNVPIYEHFGFELVETISDSKTDFHQYCLMKKPE